MASSRDKAQPFLIRKATAADLPILVDFLAKLALHVAGETPRNLKTEERDRLLSALSASLVEPDKRLVVAEATDGRLVGMGHLYVWHSQGIWEQAEEEEFKTGIIDDVWVEPEYRKLGIFSAIVKEMVGFADSHEIDELMLEYAVSNKEAAAAWTGLGFKTTGIRAAAFTSTVRERLEKRR